ncbi:hypothetical protein SAMN05444920_101983 [Nonomuraea solani]|uniref:DUF7824 domain-containing protein n=1 Tax=Nonomuraea solani TaxID=1144553 RepID=A0A1H5VUJ8_9ACTN|nr:DUF6493 family protein [Nonomuraea solani]SEF90638.1 hypothetical protein SAMN05444920_101983 [Nonomuraea solani]
MDHWGQVRKLIVNGPIHRLAAYVKSLDDDGRKQVAAGLPGLLKELRAGFDRWDDSLAAYAPALRVTGAATIGGAAGAAAWLVRREFAPRWASVDDDAHLVLAALADRPAAWRADLAERLVLRLRTANDRGMGLALALLRQTGIEPPQHDPLVSGWADGPSAKLGDDPLLDHLLPRLFEAEGVGQVLQWEKDPRQGWLAALPALAEAGRVKREALIDGCVRRFLRGGTPIDLRFFVRLHEVLDPTPAEVAAHARDYLSLLPAAPGPVAELAMKRLRTCGDLTPDDLAEAWESLLFRAERKLVRAGLSWLDRSVRRTPALANVLATPLARAFAADSAELQERAVELAVAHAGGMGEEGRATVREAIELLPPHLGHQAATVFAGGLVAEAEPMFLPPPLPPAPERVHELEFPAVSIEELDRRLMEHPASWQEWERLVAGFVMLVARDRAAVVAALRPRLMGGQSWVYRQQSWERIDLWFQGAVHSLTVTTQMSRAWRRVMPARGAAPHRLLIHRAAEILRAAEEGTLPPLLLATPTHSTGHVAAAELVRRMEVIEAAGAKPLAADLQQALLRLPRTPDPEAAARAARLTSPAGEIIASWTCPDVEITVGWSCGRDGEEHDWNDRSCDHSVVPVMSAKATPTGLPLVDLMLDVSEEGTLAMYHDWWSSMLPSHRDLAAAHLVPYLFTYYYNATSISPGQARDLARADGPAGSAFAAVLARLLGRRDLPEAIDVLLEVAARDELPAAEIGRHLALFVAGGEARMIDVITTLDSVAQRGAPAHVWRIAAAALPDLLPAPGERPRNGLTGFVKLALATAEWSDARGEIPAVRDLAARKGNSGLLRELRRLHDRLTTAPAHSAADPDDSTTPARSAANAANSTAPAAPESGADGITAPADQDTGANVITAPAGHRAGGATAADREAGSAATAHQRARGATAADVEG